MSLDILSTSVSSEVFKHISVFLGALLHVYILLYLSTSVSSGVFEQMCLMICLSKFVLSVFNNTCVSIYLVSDLFKYKCFLMYMNTSVSSDVFKHIHVSSGVFEHKCAFCFVEAQLFFSGVLKGMSSGVLQHTCLLKCLRTCFWCV